ncbi:hypothetical protein [Streptantibioticus silvisoli]|uniref:Uncharacterized protein n=1 Tax=Streptantibioticus silvisoli TaxID=2705255 RepID=A0ABT6W4W0_9ACTN|nr:hypothetical protein [Streptantibioticus silvisoli]MDI5965761.1 hypothetical protein [Streptantibioticus silvisoli]
MSPRRETDADDFARSHELLTSARALPDGDPLRGPLIDGLKSGADLPEERRNYPTAG